jgi:glycine cleavage system H protein
VEPGKPRVWSRYRSIPPPNRLELEETDLKPEDLLFVETHEWVHVEDQGGQKIGTVGISAFAIEQLTDLVFMELPKIGQTVRQGEEFGEVESVKAVSPLYSPVTGEVIEVNQELPNRLESLADDPYDQGWIAKIRISDDSNLSNLMDYRTYQEQCRS